MDFLSEHLQKEKMSPKNLPSQKSPAASSPASGKATPKLALGSPAPDKKGRFSISLVTTPLPIAEENDAVAEDMKRKKREKNGARVETPKSSQVNQAGKTFLTATPDKLTRTAQLGLKVTPMKRRTESVAVIKAKRRSGASRANLLGLFQQLIFNFNVNALKYRNKTEVGLLFRYAEATKRLTISSDGCWKQLGIAKCYILVFIKQITKEYVKLYLEHKSLCSEVEKW